MDKGKYSTLVEALKEVADPRKKRGQRHGWELILTVIAAALMSGALNGRAIGQWVREHAAELIVALEPAGGRLPSESTLRRALRQIDPLELERQLAAFAAAVAERQAEGPLRGKGVRLEGMAVDGKRVRGASRSGESLELVSLVAHRRGLVLEQQAVGAGSSEQQVVRSLLAKRSLHHRVVTLDALHTSHDLAAQIQTQGGYYLMIVKANQPKLYADIALLFERPPWQGGEYAHEVQRACTFAKRHGRLETRTLESSTALRDYLDWPGVQQVLRRHCRRVIIKNDHTTEETTFAITNLPRDLATAHQLEAFWRAHWTIENRAHYVRDVTFGEDRSLVRAGHAPHALAALRNAVINLCRAHGWLLIPDALRHFGASLHRALAVIGAPGL